MARRRTKKDDMLAYPYTPEKQNTFPSGWCMTNYHENCPYQFNHGKCGCDCHLAPKSVRRNTKAVTSDSKTQKTQKPKKESVIIADSDDPRPWKRNNE